MLHRPKILGALGYQSGNPTQLQLPLPWEASRGGKQASLSDIPGLHFDWDARDASTVLGTQPTYTSPNDWSNVAWTKTGILSTTRGQADPVGGTSATLVIESTANSAHTVEQVVTNYQVNARATLHELYVKPAGRTRVEWGMQSGTFWADFLLTGAGSVVSNGAGVDAVTIDAIAGGWYRLRMSGTGAGTSAKLYLMSAAATYSYVGDGVSGVYVYAPNTIQNRAHTYRNLILPGTRDLVQATLSRQFSHWTLPVDLLPPVMPHGRSDGVASSDVMKAGGVAADYAYQHDGAGGYTWMVVRLDNVVDTLIVADTTNGTSANAGWWILYGASILDVAITRAVGLSYVIRHTSGAIYPPETWALIGLGYLEDASAEEAWVRVNRAYVAGPVASANAPSVAAPAGTLAVSGSTAGLSSNAKISFAEAASYKRATKMTQAEIDYVEKILWNRWAPLTGWAPI